MAKLDGVRKSLAKVTREVLEEYAGKVMAVGMNGEGVITSALTREELEQKILKQFGDDYRFIVMSGACTNAKSDTY